MSRKILGLDIRSSSATAVLMESSFKDCAVTGFGHAPFPGEGSFNERLTETLAAISAEMDLKDCVCAISVPSDRFFYRNVSVPFGEAKKIQQMLPFELESEIPFPVEDLLIDFDKIPLQGSNGETRIIAAGIETDRLKNLLDAVESCGITPMTIYPVGYAAATWICSRMSDDTVLFVDFDGENCTLYLLIQGMISLIRSFHLPRDQVTSAIHLWSHIQRSIAGFESLFETRVSPGTIVLNGFPEEKFPKQLETVSSVSVHMLQVALPANCEPLNEDADALSPRDCFNGALSCALFLHEGSRGMNFRKGPLAAKNRLMEYRDRLVRTAVIAGIVVLLWFFGSVTDIILTQRKVNQIDSRISSIFKDTLPDKNFVEPVHQMRTEIERLKQAAYGSADTASQVRVIDLYKNISSNIPENLDVIFTSLQLSDKGVYTIDGTTADLNQPNEIATRIENIEGVVSAELKNTDKEGNRFQFKIRIETSREGAR